MSAPEAPIQLGKSVGLVGVVTFGAGTAIGVSIFTILGPTAQVAGAGLLPAIGLAALPMLIFALAYAYLGSALPVSGASYEWPRRFIHPAVGFLIAWMRIVANVGAMAILSQVLVGYLGMVVPLPPLPAMAALITLVFALNYRGVALAAKAQTALMALLLVVLALLVALGLPHVHVATMGAPLSVPLPQVLAAVPLMISLFLGIESAVEIGEEVRNPARTMPLGIALAIALTALVYGAVAATALGLVGPAGLAASKAPLLDAARVVMGSPAATILIVGAATLSIVKSMNALALTFSRSLFAMGRSGALPTALGRVHPRFATPHVAVLLAWACAMAGMLLPQSLVFLLLAVNLPTMLKYAACSWSATVVARHHPEIHARAALGMAPATVTLIGLAGVVAALAIAAFGVEADPRPYLLVGGWLVLGLAWWFAFARKS
ncbi:MULTISPECIES: APC family permease [unclassified Novosphingobium]|uniref:APC family permease n=1 Tax=unclassified Novosphingobium TaxID=2644732 RepID=UPI001440EDDE|nr:MULTISPECIES: amino acid permease [unclassified Novosphingobium]MBB3359410.1 APA family basic amino acid/polyamine antiporter [Novosphingobium sp. BK256]MBB3375770.1 APA family basic amino acid/polyamine antiporter [Novosphingobium sp. BK280]MBB3380183.1 APA family basic amino acid/polyamine antiporter [Novosphingobium sp. BK258]MBB3421877.1 APA family basic amino acid/polyamine antiporter [Novosphingobium sp. BK267]MBB3450533.1 APA family basic amino acid/polyamine antiporter [Novosphingob